MDLDPTAAAAGVRVIHHETIGSTNAEALSLARRGERGPLWVTAARQTDGRGRRGRSWVSEPDNLYASLLLTDPGPAERAAELSLVAALAVHDAIAVRPPGLARRLSLKWPNDVLIDGLKFAGILVQGEGPGAQSAMAVAIGIGVNCVSHPAQTAFPATDLATAGVRANLDAAFAAISGAIFVRLAQWDRGAGFDAVRTDWLARAGGLGKAIKLNTGEAAVEGRFETLDEHGYLVLQMPDGARRTITAADVTMLARA